MKTTLDLPDDLMRAVKIRAVHEQKKLKDAIAELIRKGMAAGRKRGPENDRSRSSYAVAQLRRRKSKRRSRGVANQEMLLVDTNIVAYLLIEGDHTEAAHELRARDSDWRSEAFLLVEFANVLVSSIARKRMTLSPWLRSRESFLLIRWKPEQHPSRIGLGNRHSPSSQRL